MPQQKEPKAADGLGELLHRSHAAQQYFQSLPDYVQEMIMQRRQNIRTQDELQRYANNLTARDE